MTTSFSSRAPFIWSEKFSRAGPVDPRRSCCNNLARLKLSRKKQAGFSLIETMVAAALMGGLIIALISFLRTGNSSQKSLLGQDDARVQTTNIATLLSNMPACSQTFSGFAPGGASAVAITDIKDQTGTTQFAKGKVYGNRTLTLSAINLGGPGNDARTNTQRWVPSSLPNQGTALVELDWQVMAANDVKMGPDHLLRSFQINATLDASGKITNCYALTGLASANNLGTGTKDFIPLWLDSTTLGDSVMFQQGSFVGVGNVSPLSTFSVNGGMSVGAYAGGAASPANGLIVSGQLGIRNPSPVGAVEVNGSLRLSDGGANSVSLQAPALVGAPVVWTLPAADGTPGQILATNGAGKLFWTKCPFSFSDCPAQTINDCILPAGTSGNVSAGACVAGDTGACSYKCQDGGWSEVNNTCAKPPCAPGSASYTTPGTYTFTVQAYCHNVNVTVRGGGGGGGSAYWWSCGSGAKPGGTSSFNGSIVGFGGVNGVCNGAGGAGGAGAGGIVNASGLNGGDSGSWMATGNGGNGGGPGGGAGGPAGPFSLGPISQGGDGTSPGAGGGGATLLISGSGGGGGGYAFFSYPPGALAVGANITVVVGGGGVGDSGNSPGGHGADGSVTVDWN
jgi:type II secretory pathway pseudopilin PulG